MIFQKFIVRRIAKFVAKPFLPRRFFKIYQHKNLLTFGWKKGRYRWTIRKDGKVRNRRSNYKHIKVCQIGVWKIEKLEYVS